jgi:hypothetical protein
LDSLFATKDEAQDIIQDMLSEHEDTLVPTQAPRSIFAVVEYNGYVIYKSTLVSQLNSNPFLSKVRLTQVKTPFILTTTMIMYQLRFL